MSNKTCGECKTYDHQHLLCIIGGDVEPTERAKDCFVSANPTNGDLIIAEGMRGLAMCMVYGYRETDDNGQVTGDMLYTWKHPQAKVFTEYSEAVDYLEAWLNAPAGDDNNVPAKEREVEDE